jgi:DNA-binding transcriptional regulator YiaG
VSILSYPKSRNNKGLLRRFWEKVSTISNGPNGCWEWKGGRDKDGYGVFAVKIAHATFRHMKAHRIAWELAGKGDPGEGEVCHTCDNPPCCNPKHLFLGTRLDNARDMATKGRGLSGDKNASRLKPECLKRGEQHPNAKLTEPQVSEIRRLWRAGGVTQPELARRFSVSDGTIYCIVTGRNWRHVTDDDA